MPRFEIFERSTGTIVEIVDNEFEAFRLDFRARFNRRKYGYRIPSSEPPKPHMFRVIKENENGEGNQEFLPFTIELCDKIATFNGGMTTAEVHAALQSGRTIYTNFSRYYIE